MTEEQKFDNVVDGNNLDAVSRVEVIDGKGRSYVNLKVEQVQLSLQDDNRTLKIFLTDRQ